MSRKLWRQDYPETVSWIFLVQRQTVARGHVYDFRLGFYTDACCFLFWKNKKKWNLLPRVNTILHDGTHPRSSHWHLKIDINPSFWGEKKNFFLCRTRRNTRVLFSWRGDYNCHVIYANDDWLRSDLMIIFVSENR